MKDIEDEKTASTAQGQPLRCRGAAAEVWHKYNCTEFDGTTDTTTAQLAEVSPTIVAGRTKPDAHYTPALADIAPPEALRGSGDTAAAAQSI